MLAHFSMSKAQFPCLPQRAGTGWSSIAGIATPRTQPPSTHPRSLMCASHSRREALMLATIAAPLLSHPTSQALPLAPLGAVQVGENKRTGITIQELKDILARDIGEGMYFVTGNLSPEVFDDNCRFIDPTNDVTGLSRYMKALSILFDPALSKVVLKDIKVTSPSTIDADWVSAGWLKKELFPWQPKVPPFEGHTQYTIGDNGLVVQQKQTWSISALQALRETFTPTFGPREPLL